MGLAEDAALARQLGHELLAVGETKSGRRYFITCACGWGEFRPDGSPTVTRATFREAVLSAREHIVRAVAKVRRMERANGVSLLGELDADRYALAQRCGLSTRDSAAPGATSPAPDSQSAEARSWVTGPFPEWPPVT